MYRLSVSVLCVLLIGLLSGSSMLGQSIIQTIPLPNTTYWNQAWGLAPATGGPRLYISSGTTTAVFNRGHIYSLDSLGNVLDSVVTGLNSSQGLAWDGSHFWYIRGSGASGRIYKVTSAGAVIDSIIPPSTTWFLGGACWDGTGLWVSLYSPNANAGLYKYDVATKTIVDTVPSIGQQPQGIAWDGQFLYYAMDLNSTEPNLNLIYVVDPATRDTVRTIPMPDPSNVDSNPRGLAWDGRFLWLVAEPVGASSGRVLYKYDLSGSGTPAINVPNRFFDMGRIRIGNQQQATVTIQSNGTAPLRVDSVQVIYSSNYTTDLVTPVTIPEGNLLNFSVTFAPTTFGTDSAHVVLYHNDPSRGPQIVRLTGLGIYPTSHIVAPASRSFGVRRVGSTNMWTVTFENRGALPFTVDSISFTIPQFYLQSGSVPLTVDSVNSRDVRVWFNPTSASGFSDTMRVYSNASNAPVVAIPLSGSGDATPVPLGGVMWEGAVPDNPFTSSDDYQTKSIKQIGDMNGDGINDVVVASGNYLVSCFNGASSVTGDILWIFNMGTNNNNSGSVDWEDALQVRDDIDNDGVQDVVFGCAGGNESVYTLSGRTGQLIWVWGDSTNPGLGDIMGVRVDRDYNGDNVKDVLVSASGTSNFGGRHAVVCLNGVNGQEIFYRQLGQNFTYDIVSTVLGGAIGAGNDGASYSVNGFDTLGLPMWSYPLAGSLNATWSLKEIPDINNDGLPDILGLHGFIGGIFAITADAGIQLWASSLGSSNNGKIILLDDMNNNGFADFALSAPQVLYRLDTQNGSALWSVGLSSSYIRGIDYLSDVNGDGIRDIAVATQQPGRIVVVDGTNGSTLFDYVFGTNIAQRGDRVATLASIDGNVSTEFAGGNREGRVICFSGGQSSGTAVHPGTGLPEEFSVSQNYPNPFNPSTSIEVRLPIQSDITLKIFDMLGREVRVFEYNNAQAGVHTIVWDGTNQRGTSVASGAYFYQVRAGETVLVRRMLLLK